MKQIRKRLTYANVLASVAIFLAIGGAAAFAAHRVRRNSVGTRQLKAKAVTTAKIKNGAVTGAKVRDNSLTGVDINLATLGTVPSAHTATSALTAVNATNAVNAANATTAANLTGRTPFQLFAGAGLREVAKVGPFTIQANCAIDVAGNDTATLQLLTSENNSAMDDNSGDQFSIFGPGDIAKLIATTTTTGTADIEAGSGEFTAVAPDGTVIAFDNQAVGVNIANHGGQCFFSGILEKIS